MSQSVIEPGNPTRKHSVKRLHECLHSFRSVLDWVFIVVVHFVSSFNFFIQGIKVSRAVSIPQMPPESKEPLAADSKYAGGKKVFLKCYTPEHERTETCRIQ